MKKIMPLITIIVLLVFPANTVQAKNKTIVDYYNMAVSNLPDWEKHKIFIEDNDYYHLSWTGDKLPVMVDFKNGYLSFQDYGAGVSNYQAAIFINNRKDMYLALNRTFTEEPVVECTCDFYLMKNNNIAKTDLLPKINLAMFQKKPVDHPILKDSLVVMYNIPRIGTTIKAELNYVRLKYGLKDEEHGNEYRKLMNNIKFTHFDLVWDRNKSRFVIRNLR